MEDATLLQNLPKMCSEQFEGFAAMTVLAVTRPSPPRVAQRLSDSCWAASLESWSRAEGSFPNQSQNPLIRRFGEGPTGGITPWAKIPLFAQVFQLHWAGVESRNAVTYLTQNLSRSYVFCAYSVGTFTHSILIHRLDLEAGNVRVMDPDGGHYVVRTTRWFETMRGGFIMMRR